MTLPSLCTRRAAAAVVAVIALAAVANASLGDRLPDFRDCVQVCMPAPCSEPTGHS